MKQAGTRKLYAYWNNLRAARMAPERDDIDPAAIRALLRDTFILEIDSGRTLPVRVAGERMSSLFTRELKGASLMQLFHADAQECLAAIIGAVLDDPTPAVVGVSASPEGRAPIDLELLLLPLRHRGKTHARVLGSLTPSAAPVWLGLLAIGPMRINSLRILRSDIARETRAAAEAAPVVATLDLSPRERWRVVQGGQAG